jgi:isovaleryl-CoA dehydrogenase
VNRSFDSVFTAEKLASCFSSTATSNKSAIGASKAPKHDFFNPTEEHLALRNLLRSFVENEVDKQALEYNRKEQFNYELFKKLGDLGILGITADTAHGGSGMDAVAAVIAHEELAASDPAFCLSFLAHSMLFVNNLNQNGNEMQKAKFLPASCTGEKVGGMCMSEPGAGTDVLGMSTVAKPSPDGNHYILNGSKLWITNGTIDGKTTGDFYLVYAKTGAGRGANDLTSFLVEKNTPGFTLGQKIEDKCGMRASMTAELVFADVKVPKENIVGTVGGATLCMVSLSTIFDQRLLIIMHIDR